MKFSYEEILKFKSLLKSKENNEKISFAFEFDFDLELREIQDLDSIKKLEAELLELSLTEKRLIAQLEHQKNVTKISKLTPILETLNTILKDLDRVSIRNTSFTVSKSIKNIAISNDLLDLYICKAQTMPTNSFQKLILHNDLIYLSTKISNMQSLGYAQKLLEKSKSLIHDLVASETDIVIRIIDKFGTISCDTPKRFNHLQNIVNQTVIPHFLQLHATLTCTSSSTQLIVLGKVYSTFLALVSKEIVSLPAIGEQESQSLFDLLDFKTIDRLFLDHLDLYVDGYPKFKTLVQLLTWNLKDILECFRMGALCDFESSELIGLIQALFSATPLRNEVVDEINKTRR